VTQLPYDECPHKLWVWKHRRVWQCCGCGMGTSVDAPPWPRTGCIVPFCRRTTTMMEAEWICGTHWRLVDMGLRRLGGRLLRRWKRTGRWDDQRKWRVIGLAYEGWWKRVKRQAIERAAGIG
jgi:hypothetical protein